jgi:hypothetical protein
MPTNCWNRLKTLGAFVTTHDPTDEGYNTQASYHCFDCGRPFSIEHRGVSDPESYGATIKHHPGGCPYCYSVNNELFVLIVITDDAP